MQDAIVATDVEGRIYWTSRAFRRLCGYSKKEVFGRRPDEFLGGKDTNPETLKAIREAIRNEESINVEVLNYHKKGQPYWVSLELNPTRGNDGRLTGFIALEQEIEGQENGFVATRAKPDPSSFGSLERSRKRGHSRTVANLNQGR